MSVQAGRCHSALPFHRPANLILRHPPTYMPAMAHQAIKNWTVAPTNAAKRLRRCSAASFLPAASAEAPALPDDVVEEILARLPVRSVLRCKSVCKGWHAMLSHPSFVRRHLERSAANPSVVLLHEQMQKCGSMSMTFCRCLPGREDADLLFDCAVPDRERHYSYPDKDGPRVISAAHCDGLLVVCSRRTTCLSNQLEVYLCNPATRQCMQVPPWRLDESDRPEGFSVPNVSLCRDARSGAYKVFHAHYRGRPWPDMGTSFNVEVLTPGGEQSRWRDIPDCPHCPTVPASTASIDGAVCWLISDDDSAPSAILCLDASTEKFTRIPIPATRWRAWHTTSAIIKAVRGKLFFFRVFRRSRGARRDVVSRFVVQIWFMAGSPASPRWKWRCNCDVPDLVCHGNEVLLHLWGSFYSYGRVSGKLKELTRVQTGLKYFDLRTRKKYSSVDRIPTLQVTDYAESLVAINRKPI